MSGANPGGRPRLQIDAGAIMELRGAGRSWRAIEKLTGASARTARRAVRDFALMRGKTPQTPVAKPILEGAAVSPDQFQMPFPRVYGFVRRRGPVFWLGNFSEG